MQHSLAFSLQSYLLLLFPKPVGVCEIRFSAANIKLALLMIFNVKHDVRFDVALRKFSLNEAPCDGSWDMVTETVMQLPVTMLLAVGMGVGSMMSSGFTVTGAILEGSICISLLSSP